MGAINPRPGGTGGAGGPVTIADITDAGAIGADVLAAATAAGVREVIGLEARPLADAGAWTCPSGVAVAASTLTATLTVADGSARIVAETGYALRRTGLELVARIAYVGSLSTPTEAWAEIGFSPSALVRDGWHFQLRGDGELSAMKMPGFVGASVAGSIAGTWVRAIVTSASTVDAYYSTAATRPTTEAGWTYLTTLTGVPSNIDSLLHAGLASGPSGIDAVATISGLTLRGWPL